MFDDFSNFDEDPVYIERSMSAPPVTENASQSSRQGYNVSNDFTFNDGDLFINNSNASRLNPRMPAPVRNLHQELGESFNPDNFFNAGSDVILDETLLGSKGTMKSLVIDGPRTPMDLIQADFPSTPSAVFDHVMSEEEPAPPTSSPSRGRQSSTSDVSLSTSSTNTTNKGLRQTSLDDFEHQATLGMSQLYVSEDSSMQQAVNAAPYHPPQVQQQMAQQQQVQQQTQQQSQTQQQQQQQQVQQQVQQQQQQVQQQQMAQQQVQQQVYLGADGNPYMINVNDMQQMQQYMLNNNSMLQQNQYNNNNNNNMRNHRLPNSGSTLYYQTPNGPATIDANGMVHLAQANGTNNANNAPGYAIPQQLNGMTQQQQQQMAGNIYMPVDPNGVIAMNGAPGHMGLGNMVAVSMQQGPNGYYIPQPLAPGTLYLDPNAQQNYYRVGGVVNPAVYGQGMVGQSPDDMNGAATLANGVTSGILYQDANGNIIDGSGVSYIIPYAQNPQGGGYWPNGAVLQQNNVVQQQGNMVLNNNSSNPNSNGPNNNRRNQGNNNGNSNTLYGNSNTMIMSQVLSSNGQYLVNNNNTANVSGSNVSSGTGGMGTANGVNLTNQINSSSSATPSTLGGNGSSNNRNGVNTAAPNSPHKQNRGGMNASANAYAGNMANGGGYQGMVSSPQLGYAAAVMGGSNGMLTVDSSLNGQILMQIDGASGVAIPVPITSMIAPGIPQRNMDNVGNNLHHHHHQHQQGHHMNSGNPNMNPRNNNRNNNPNNNNNNNLNHRNNNNMSNALISNNANNNNNNLNGVNGNNTVRDSVVEEFRNTYGKTKQWDIHDLLGHVVAFCQDQHGSRFIQQRLEVALDDEKQLVFDEVLLSAHSLMTDVFGNYVIQKLFEYGTPNQCETLALLLMGQAVPLALQMYGCRVIQKALEYVNTERLVNIIQEFEQQPVREVLRCVHDQNGNHVIQKCIEVISRLSKDASTELADYLSSRIQFIISAFHGRVRELSMHPYGCRVVQRILEHCTNAQKTCILDELRQCCNELIQDQYGNYVIQHVMQHGWEPDRTKLVKEVQSRLLEYSQHKFASNVVEKCLQYADLKDRDEMIWTIINVTFDLNNPVDAKTGQCVLESMVRDPYANYVVQKVIDVSNERQRGAIIRYVRENIVQLRRYTYGKHIIVRLEKVSGEKF